MNRQPTKKNNIGCCVIMAASAFLARTVRSLSVTLRVSSQFTRKLDAGKSHRRSRLPCISPSACVHTGVFQNTEIQNITVTDEPDALYQTVAVLVKGHDCAVLDSYEFFATMAAQELGIHVGKVCEPKKTIERMTLLKSVHIFKKHRVQYEMRTHYRCIELARVTGSTAKVYLEYIQRNLPEGVAMEVTKTELMKIPEHIQKPMWDSVPQVEQPSQREVSSRE
ncbi:small ribosomal subunit protein uS10m [Anguilla rostrata]|uniref:small ribosomal subunit protein uS10m n=1 Tax=Anguilla rostrata TaxID=7938 RepID=UPI0030CF98FE